jgi:hypothetical protein
MSFIKIDDESISLQKVIGYLQLFGRLRPFVETIVSLHVIYNEILSHPNLEINSAEFEQAVIDFRLQHNLSDAEKFQQWLVQEGMDYQAFQSRVVLAFKWNKLKHLIAEPQSNQYFAEHRAEYTQYDLSGLVTGDQELIETLQLQLMEPQASFDEITKPYTSPESPLINVLRGLTRLKQLPEELRTIIQETTPGEWVGPLQVGGGWCLFRVEAVVPPRFEGQLKQELEEQLFTSWLAEKVTRLNVELLPMPNVINDS